MASTNDADGIGHGGLSTAAAHQVAAISGVVVALSAVAFFVFGWVVFEEMSYASSHPYAYGPAKVIAAAAAAGAVLSVAVGILARALQRAAR